MAEKYQVSARRYRPQRFSEVVGQEAILQTLKNALRKDLVAHAYLFSGSRGVGKTTLARLFAKALNCSALTQECEPCNQCPSCLDIASGQALDVIEIDGASNRGIDDIRQINETVAFAPGLGQFKIYIIDEVHMLTKEAFNALLKTLEEPPEKAKFFFATTEPHKVLPTIISRCQRFDLGRLSPEQISAKLASIALDLNRQVEPAALQLLARFADGALRDAESLFDQILCFAPNQIAIADVQNALGLVPQDHFFALDQAFSTSRLGFAFELTDQIFLAGKDPSHFLEQLIEHYRNLTVYKTFKTSDLSHYAPSAALYTQPQCLNILDLLLKAEAQMSKSISPRIALEMTLLQILRTKNKIPIEALIRRLSEMQTGEKSPEPTPQAASPEPAVVVREPAPQATPPEPAVVVREPTLQAASPEPAVVVREPTPQAAPPEPAVVVREPTPQAASPESAVVVREPTPQAAPPEPIELKPVPFNPFKPIEEPVIKPTLPTPPSLANKHQSHYDTLMRFAAVELEGTFKN